MLRFCPEICLWLVANARWLGAGVLLTFASSFGQTWFISLFAGFIKDQHGLSDGSWGSLYTVATLGAAALLFWRGALADSVPFAKLAPLVGLLFALAAVGMAFAPSVWVLGLCLFGLRFCGQGMFSHMAMTAMGRWFEARRGRAVAIANLGHPLAEIVLPFGVIFVIALLGWQSVWLIVAVLLALLVTPALRVLLDRSRTAQGHLSAPDTPGLAGRHWQRSDAVRHWLLPALLPILLTPGFIGTVIFFHQVHVADVKGWTIAQMAPGYGAYAALTVTFALVGGWASDRFGAHMLLPVFLIPMAIGIALVGPIDIVLGWYVALGFIGMTQGLTSALQGVLYPAVYGTRHLGSIRSMATTIMVVSTAIGPGVTGILIDQGIDFPDQALAMGAWSIGLSCLGFWIARRLSRELPLRGVPARVA